MRYEIPPDRHSDVCVWGGQVLLTRWIPPFPVTGRWEHVLETRQYSPELYPVSRLLRDELFYRGVFPVKRGP